MYMLKLLIQILQIRPILAPGETADRLGTSGGSRALALQGEKDDHCPWEQLTAQDRDVAASFT